MTIRRIILTALAVASMSLFIAPGGAMAAVTTDISGVEAGGAANGGMEWDINYDDVTRNVTATALGSGFCIVTIQVTNTISRTVAFYPGSLNVDSQNPDLAARMDAADFRVLADGTPTVIASNISPNQVKRLLGKATATIGGFQGTSEWSRH